MWVTYPSFNIVSLVKGKKLKMHIESQEKWNDWAKQHRAKTFQDKIVTKTEWLNIMRLVKLKDYNIA
jgi:hypothetical protein